MKQKMEIPNVKKYSGIDLLEELSCPICTDYLTLPINQCATGHSVCGKCIEVLEKCVICKSEFTDLRNFALEALAVKMKYPCKNEHAGCTKQLEYSERESHEIKCMFQNFQISCQMKGCSFVGDPEALKIHWKEKKNTSKVYGAFNRCNLKVKHESYYVNLVEACGSLFWFKSKITNGLFYFALQLIGNNEHAHLFFYQIEIHHESLPKKKVIVSDYCKSIALSNEDLFKEEICIILYLPNLKLFISDPQTVPNLNYIMKVFKIIANPKFRRRQEISGKHNNECNQSSDLATFPDQDYGIRSDDNISARPLYPSVQEQEYEDNCCCRVCTELCVIS